MTSVAEARAFLDQFLRTEWGACHVRAGGLELFVARTRDHANPMIAGVAAAHAVTRATLRAPHLGTVATLAGIGATIAVGEAYATLDLLGERVPLTAAEGGVVIGRLAEIGGLAEYDQPLLALG